ASQAANELISLVRDLGGSLAVFEHTLDEIRGVLLFATRHFDDPSIETRILREIRSAGVALSDLIVCMDQLRERLAAKRIRAVSTPSYERPLQIDEVTFRSALEDEIRYHGDHALQYDINSVRSIYVLRRGVEPARLEDAVAVFVTTNSTFAKV